MEEYVNKFCLVGMYIDTIRKAPFNHCCIIS